MKISNELSNKIYNKYKELKAEGKFKKKHIYKLIVDYIYKEEGVTIGITTAFDHSRSRDLRGDNVDVVTEEIVEVASEPWVPKVKSMPSVGYNTPSIEKKTYILTGWEIRVGINDGFIKCIEHLKNHLDAEAMIVPVWDMDATFIPQKIKDVFTVVQNNIKFNSNLTLEYISSHALTQSTITGWMGAFPGKSVILPGLTKELISEPSVHACKAILTTGSVGYLNAEYDQFDNIEQDSDFRKRWGTTVTRAGGKALAIAQRFIKPTALIVDILDDDTFLTRYVTMENEGVIYDLNKKITPSGIEDSQPSGLVLGDHHAYELDYDSHRAALEMIKRFNPKEVVLNDFFDGKSVSHWDISDSVNYNNAPSIEEEAEITKKILKEITDISNKVIYLQSNHCNFLLKFLQSNHEAHWKLNGNLPICYELQAYRVRTGKHPIIRLLDLDKIDNLLFVSEKAPHYIENVAVLHGHNSYARPNFKGFVKTYNKIVIGHFHSPQVFRNGVCCGVTGKAEMEYSVGANACLGANCLIQPDDSLQLLPIIEGRWMK